MDRSQASLKDLSQLQSQLSYTDTIALTSFKQPQQPAISPLLQRGKPHQVLHSIVNRIDPLSYPLPANLATALGSQLIDAPKLALRLEPIKKEEADRYRTEMRASQRKIGFQPVSPKSAQITLQQLVNRATNSRKKQNSESTVGHVAYTEPPSAVPFQSAQKPVRVVKTVFKS